MLKKGKQLVSFFLSLLLCFHNLYVPVLAEEEYVPEATEEPVTQVSEEFSEDNPSEVIEIVEENQGELILEEETETEDNKLVKSENQSEGQNFEDEEITLEEGEDNFE